MEKIFIGVAWPYVSGYRHLGHVAGFGVPCDIFARYHRLKGDQVLMVSGSDMHGTPITVKAEQEGKTPAEVAEPLPRGPHGQPPRARLFLRPLHLHRDRQPQGHRPGHLHSPSSTTATSTRRRTRQLYCPRCERFLPDRYVEGICPCCGFTDARGDQCDQCGRRSTRSSSSTRAARPAPPPERARDGALLPRPADVHASVSKSTPTSTRASGARTSRSSRAAPRRVRCADGRSPATSTGACRCRSRATRTRSSTSGSTRSSAT